MGADFSYYKFGRRPPLPQPEPRPVIVKRVGEMGKFFSRSWMSIVGKGSFGQGTGSAAGKLMPWYEARGLGWWSRTMILWGGAPTRSIKLEIKLDQGGASTTLFDPPFSEKAMFTPNELLSGLDMEVCTTLCTFGEDGKSFIITSQYKTRPYTLHTTFTRLSETEMSMAVVIVEQGDKAMTPSSAEPALMVFFRPEVDETML